MDDLVNLSCVLPPSLKEQTDMLFFVDQAFTPVLETEKKLAKQIEKLQEYRRSLITAAVTGKLDINHLEQEA